jgi:hypothetical protein
MDLVSDRRGRPNTFFFVRFNSQLALPKFCGGRFYVRYGCWHFLCCYIRAKCETMLTATSPFHAGGRTAWSSIVTIGTVKIPARCWYSGHYNAHEDACEVFLKELHKLEQWNEPRTSLSRAATFPAYRTPSNAGGPNGFYGSIGEVAAPPQFSGSLGPHIHPELMSRGSQQPHSASFVSHYSS